MFGCERSLTLSSAASAKRRKGGGIGSVFAALAKPRKDGRVIGKPKTQ